MNYRLKLLFTSLVFVLVIFSNGIFTSEISAETVTYGDIKITYNDANNFSFNYDSTTNALTVDDIGTTADSLSVTTSSDSSVFNIETKFVYYGERTVNISMPSNTTNGYFSAPIVLTDQATVNLTGDMHLSALNAPKATTYVKGGTVLFDHYWSDPNSDAYYTETNFIVASDATLNLTRWNDIVSTFKGPDNVFIDMSFIIGNKFAYICDAYFFYDDINNFILEPKTDYYVKISDNGNKDDKLLLARNDGAIATDIEYTGTRDIEIIHYLNKYSDSIELDNNITAPNATIIINEDVTINYNSYMDSNTIIANKIITTENGKLTVESNAKLILSSNIDITDATINVESGATLELKDLGLTFEGPDTVTIANGAIINTKKAICDDIQIDCDNTSNFDFDCSNGITITDVGDSEDSLLITSTGDEFNTTLIYKGDRDIEICNSTINAPITIEKSSKLKLQDNTTITSDISAPNTTIDIGNVNFTGGTIQAKEFTGNVSVTKGMLYADKIAGNTTIDKGLVFLGDTLSTSNNKFLSASNDSKSLVLCNQLRIKDGEKFILGDNTTYVIFNGVTVEPGGIFDCSKGKVITYNNNHQLIVQGGGDFTYGEINNSSVVPPIVSSDSSNSYANLSLPADVNGGLAKAEVSLYTMENTVNKVSSSTLSNKTAPIISINIISSENYDDLEVNISTKSLINFCKNSGAKLIIKSKLGEVTFDSTAIKYMVSNKKETLTFKFNKVSSSSSIYNLSISKGNHNFSYFGGGIVTIELPYVLESGKNPIGVKGYFVDTVGNKYECDTVYNQNNSTATISTNHFSTYMVEYKNLPTFKDTTDHTAKDDIEFVAFKGLMCSYNDGNFYPDNGITREELAVTLAKLGKINQSTLKSGLPSESSFFEDVEYDSALALYVNWVSKNGIITKKSSTKNNFNPKDVVTHQEITSALNRFTELYSGNPSYIQSKNADASLTYAGISKSSSSTLTRAELAMILKQYIS